jgi:hypothetical protein
MRKECVIKSFSLGATRALCLLFGLMISALASSSLMAVDCTSDYIELNSQARIDSFQSDYGGGGTCDTVPGTLRVGGPDVVDLTPLSALTTVRDQFQIRQTNNLIDLDGLSALTSVGGDQTDAAGSFHIFDNAALTNFIGLSGLANVGGTLYISGNAALTNLDGFSALTSVGGLSIGDNDSLTNLNGLSALTSASVPWSIAIGGNAALTNLDGLSALTSVGGDLAINHNPALANLDSLSALTSVDGVLDLRGNTALTNLDGLSALTNVGGLFQIIGNPVLTDIDGLSALTDAGGGLNIKTNDALVNLDGLSALTNVRGLIISRNPVLTNLSGLSALTSVAWSLEIEGNAVLPNLDGLSNLTSVGSNLIVEYNSQLKSINGMNSLRSVGNDFFLIDNNLLSNCTILTRLLDQIDDYEPGPGPGEAGIPDIGGNATLQYNSSGCNSVTEILGDAPLLEINAGLNDAWFNPKTPGQGFLITVFPEIKQLFIAWFTYDTERPPEDVSAFLGEPGHRWLTAQGEYEENAAELILYVTTGGVFDSPEPEPVTEPYGEIMLEFSTCNAGTVTYDIPSVDRQGVIPIERIVLDNVSLCYMLNSELADEAIEQ